VRARLKHVDIEGFRGFAERRSIDLDADGVVIRGDNGAGKTSVVDALLWVLAGELAHLVDRVRGLRRAEDVVKNRFNPYGARVALTLGVDGVDYVVTRSGDQKATALELQADDGELFEGAAAEARLAELFGVGSPAELRLAVSTWGLLRQDAIRAALDAAGGALHERLSGLIGLERVSAFATAATRASDALVRERTAARTAHGRTEQRHTEALERLKAARQAAGSPDNIGHLLRNGLANVDDQLPEGVALVVPSAPDIEVIKASWSPSCRRFTHSSGFRRASGLCATTLTVPSTSRPAPKTPPSRRRLPRRSRQPGRLRSSGSRPRRWASSATGARFANSRSTRFRARASAGAPRAL
jgi:hypothetical protein